VKGCYVLVARIALGQEIGVGRLGTIRFNAGYYAYTGSGRRSVEGRIARHLRRERKKLHWHIDYLLERAEITGVYIYTGDGISECSIARRMMPLCSHVRGFGCSDCRCGSHLFYCSEESGLRRAIAEAAGNNTAPLLPGI